MGTGPRLTALRALGLAQGGAKEKVRPRAGAVLPGQFVPPGLAGAGVREGRWEAK